jgi:hypothetical protein
MKNDERKDLGVREENAQSPLSADGGVVKLSASYDRQIARIENQDWSRHSIVLKVTLDCGHVLYATDVVVFGMAGVDCQACGGTGTIRELYPRLQRPEVTEGLKDAGRGEERPIARLLNMTSKSCII